MTTTKFILTLLINIVMAASIAGCSTMRGAAPVAAARKLSAGWMLQDAAKVADAPQVISQPNYATNGWYRAVVPGTVLTTLVANGVYPEPLYGENNRPDRIPESLARATYWYRTDFPVPAAAKDGHVWLKLDGINYTADIWVNGQKVGTMRGAFTRGVFDITNEVRGATTAAVAVEIFPTLHPGSPHEHTVAGGMGGNGGILAIDGPTFLCSIGWDWIPAIRDRNIGIWQDVSLSESGSVVIENPLVTSELSVPKYDSADVTVQTTVHNISGQPWSGMISGTLESVHVEKKLTLAGGESQVVQLAGREFPQLKLKNPRLWWPNGYGPQNLYTLQLRLESSHVISDQREVSFGIRKITYRVPSSENLTISVNGVPIICKGGDWGIDEAMKRSPRERLEAQIRLHQMANYNMIRNWVGQSTSEDFYDLCDRHGILVWDEFFQPNPSDGPDPTDTEMYLSNVREKVLRFRNHPSIALWCARNEGNPPAAIDAGIQKIMTELEPQRLYQRNSGDGRGVRSGGPYQWRAPVQFYTFPAFEAFKTELGSVSIPTLEAVEAMMPQKDWTPLNDDWAEHDLARGASQSREFTYPQMMARRYGPWSDLPEFVRESQLANYEAFRAMYEGRFAKLFQPVTGVLTWMSNPAQPSMVWQIYSHDLEPNASFFAVRKACEPVHVQMNQDNFHVMVINATPTALAGLHARVRVLNMDAKTVYDRDLPISAGASAATDAGAIEWPTAIDPVHFIKLELRDEDGRLVSDNFYWRTLKLLPPTTAPSTFAASAPTTASTSPATMMATSRPTTRPTTQPRNFQPASREDFSDLQKLPTVQLETTLVAHEDGKTCFLNATIKNPGEGLALMAHIQLRKAKSDTRVLPVYYSDNYISLLPHESKTIQIEIARSDLGDEEPALSIDGWNIAAARVAVSH